MATRPVVTVYDLEGKKVAQIKTPAVFNAPIRSDVVTTVHTHMAKNRRQAYAVKHQAGMRHSAESWGTGRAVARIPRVAGSGTGRAGQAAFGNMCRKGRMFAPTKTWRKWHRKIAVNQRRYATVSAIAATAVPALVMARGHAIGKVAEIPLVIDDSLESITKTKEAVAALKAIGAGSDIAKAKASRQVRTGIARLRGRAHTGRKSVLVVYANDNGIVKAFRNIPGVDVCNVNRMNLLQLAPGATLGRFVIFTKSAAQQLNNVFGTTSTVAVAKKGYKLPRAVVANADLASIINSDAIQSVLRLKKTGSQKVRSFNPLTNARAMAKLNPYAAVVKKAEANAQLRAKAARAAKVAAKKAGQETPITPLEAKKRAQKKAAEKTSKATFKWISTGVVASKDELKKSAFDVKKYKAHASKRTVKTAAEPVYSKDLAPKVAARVAAAKDLAAKAAARAEKQAKKYSA